MTQKERVLSMLQSAGPSGVRSDAFFAAHLPRAAARILELKNEGNEIEAEREGKFTRYRLAGLGSAAASPKAVDRNDRAVESGGPSEEPNETQPLRCPNSPGEPPASLFEATEKKPRPRSAFVDGDWDQAA